MSAKTLEKNALTLVQRIVAANKAGNGAEALELARSGALAFPTFTIPQVLPGGFASLAEKFAGAESAPVAPKVAEPVKPVKAAPKVETVTLRLVHDGVAPTSLFGVPKDSQAHRIIGRKADGGEGWGWWGPTEAFWMRNSKGYAPDMVRIERAISRLESARGEHGEQLYRVERDIRTTDADGNALPVYETKAARQARMAEWQKAYTGRMNAANWQLGIGQGGCATCHRTGLDVRTGRITRDSENLPITQCVTCTGEAEPVVESVDLGALALALDSQPAPMPESATCPTCRQLVEVVDGALKLHTKPFTSAACRGKLGVQPEADVEPEPAAPKPAARKSAPKKAAKAEKAAAAPVVPDTSDLVAELTAALATGADLAPIMAQLEARAQQAREAAAAAEAEKAEPVEVIGQAWKFRTVTGMTNSKLKGVATDARSDLARALPKGVKVEVRRDRDALALVATVVEAPEMDAKAAREVGRIVREVVGAQRGVLAGSRA